MNFIRLDLPPNWLEDCFYLQQMETFDNPFSSIPPFISSTVASIKTFSAFLIAEWKAASTAKKAMVVTAAVGLALIPVAIAVGPMSFAIGVGYTVLGIGAIVLGGTALNIAAVGIYKLMTMQNSKDANDLNTAEKKKPQPAVEQNEEEMKWAASLREEKQKEFAFKCAQQQLKFFLRSDKKLWELFSYWVTEKKHCLTPPKLVSYSKDEFQDIFQQCLNQMNFNSRLESRIRCLIRFISYNSELRITFCNHLRAMQQSHPEEVELILPFCENILRDTTPEYEERARVRAERRSRWKRPAPQTQQALVKQK